MYFYNLQQQIDNFNSHWAFSRCHNWNVWLGIWLQIKPQRPNNQMCKNRHSHNHNSNCTHSTTTFNQLQFKIKVQLLLVSLLIAKSIWMGKTTKTWWFKLFNLCAASISGTSCISTLNDWKSHLFQSFLLIIFFSVLPLTFTAASFPVFRPLIAGLKDITTSVLNELWWYQVLQICLFHGWPA